MNRDSNHEPSRRQALHRSLGTIAGIAIVSVAGRSALAAPAKLAKSAVQYVDAGQDEGKDCDDCSQFIPGRTAKDLGTCKIVEGNINPHGHCIAFTPKPKT
jgi:hypothetical protein